nr:DUF2231 domain-containing protein [Ramlibacter aurantiacus]
MVLFLGATLSDLAYAATYHVQWTNFGSWLIPGALLLTGLALLFTLADLIRVHRRAAGIGAYAVVLVITWILGFINALVHARDAWGAMPMGLWLSVITTVLAAAATWLGFSHRHPGVPR